MHELSLVQDLLDIAQEHTRREGATAIRTVGLRAGALSGVVPEALGFAFEACKVGTLAEEAKLELEWVPLKAHCERCGEVELEHPLGPTHCPVCGQLATLDASDQELTLAYLDVV